MNREEAFKLIQKHVANQNIIKHMLAVEAVMGALAEKLEPEKVEEWKLAGLLHDGDYGESVPVSEQGVQIGQWAEEQGLSLSEEVKQAMASHNASNTGVKPEAKMDWALFACDSLTGLIVAGALVLPSKKLADLTVESVLKRYKEPSFARGTRRKDIITCEDRLGLPLPEFVNIALKAMQEISDELSL